MSKRADGIRRDEAGMPPEPKADTLCSEELAFQEDPPKKPREPIPVLVWLRFSGTPVRTPAHCIEFTSKAALVRYEVPGAKASEQVWVWASCVTRR